MIEIGPLPIVSLLNHDSSFITQEKGGEIALWKDDGLGWDRITSLNCDFKMFCKIIVFDEILVHPYSNCQVKLTKIDDVKSSKERVGVISESAVDFGMAMCVKYIGCVNKLLMCFENSSVCTVNTVNGEFEDVTKFNSDCPICFDYCDSSNFGIIGYSGSEIIKFTVDSASYKIKCLKGVELKNPGCSSISIRNDGLLFAIGSWDHSIKYFSSKSLKLLAVLIHHNSPVECLKFVPNILSENNESSKESYLLAGGRDGRVSLWNLYPT